MKTKYEGLYIFPEGLAEDELNASCDKVKEEIEKLEGAVLGTTNLGRRVFAREMGKVTAGLYVIMDMEIEGTKVDELKTRLKLATNVFRVQYVVKEEAAQEA